MFSNKSSFFFIGYEYQTDVFHSGFKCWSIAVILQYILRDLTGVYFSNKKIALYMYYHIYIFADFPCGGVKYRK